MSVPPSLDAFKLVYRADGSGTTALLTRHLRAVCETGGALRFTGKSVFREEFPPGPLPAHFVEAHGDDGAAAAMAGNVSAITYIGPDPVYTAGIKQAWLVNLHDGVAYLPTSANVLAAMESTGAPALPNGTAVGAVRARRAGRRRTIRAIRPTGCGSWRIRPAAIRSSAPPTWC